MCNSTRNEGEAFGSGNLFNTAPYLAFTAAPYPFIGGPAAFVAAIWILFGFSHEYSLERRGDYLFAAMEAGCWITKSGNFRLSKSEMAAIRASQWSARML